MATQTAPVPKRLTKTEQAAQDRLAILGGLRGEIKPGDTLYTIVRHVAPSGMSRTISLVMPREIVQGDGTTKIEIADITHTVAKALQMNYDPDRGGIKIGGCGMDFAWNLVYLVGRALFPDGGPLEFSPREYQERGAGRTIETDGGYLLKQRAL